VQVEGTAPVGRHPGQRPLVVQGHRVPQAAGQELGPGEADRPHPVLGCGHGQQKVLLQTREVQGPGVTPGSAAAARKSSTLSAGPVTVRVLRSQSTGSGVGCQT
jgi:hypothetical protein